MKLKNKYLITTMKISFAILITILIANFFFAGTTQQNVVFTNDLPDTIKTVKPNSYYLLEDQLVNTILTRYHYKKFDLNDSLSSIILDRFINSLDNGKNYFLKSDIDLFEKYRNKLDDDIKSGDISPFYEIFNVFLSRMVERVNYINTLLDTEFDYTKDEKFLVNRDKAVWQKNEEGMNDLWRKRIKNDALGLKLNGKDWEAIQSNLKKRYENYSRILDQYNSEDVFQLAMNSFTEAIDPHTNYLSPITSDNFKIDMSLSLEGIGARLQSDDGYTKIVEIIPGGPAFKSEKLHVDDRIVAVAQGDSEEFVDVVGWRITDVVQLIRGPKGTKVRLQIIGAGKTLNSIPKEIALIRDKIKLEDQSAQSSVIDVINGGESYKMGVITIPKFYIDFDAERNGDKNYKSTSRDIKNLLVDLEKKNIDGLIIDLRNDGGGSLEEAIKVTGLFIKDGPVVQVRNANGQIMVDKDLDPDIVYSGPMAVLVNRYSASASEIFSGAIQNYGRGLIIGENTYGKGTVQNLIDLNRISSSNKFKLGQVKLTIAKFYRIDGSSTQKVGVIPDIVFPSPIDQKDFGESSEPSALPWDKINATDYKKFSELNSFIPKLNQLSENRRNSDPEFKYIREDIEEYKEAVKRDYVSLNENMRKKEKEEKEEKEFQRENERRKVKGLKLLKKGETPPENEEETPDPYLTESAQIIADYIKLSIG
ncbi:carboxy terminal-processing peptidase [bacterium BMS3Abin03]|nr:carboxy terminal-processing peptidase [bacterium BMS3Abin03]